MFENVDEWFDLHANRYKLIHRAENHKKEVPAVLPPTSSTDASSELLLKSDDKCYSEYDLCSNYSNHCSQTSECSPSLHNCTVLENHLKGGRCSSSSAYTQNQHLIVNQSVENNLNEFFNSRDKTNDELHHLKIAGSAIKGK